MLMSHLSRNQVFQLRRLRTRIIKEMLRFSYCQSISEAAYQKAVKEYPANLPKISVSDKAIIDALNCEGVFVIVISNKNETLLAPKS